MRELYEELVQRIRGETVDLDRLVDRVLTSWSRSQKYTDEKELYLDAVALNLHGFYSGLERLFELIAKHVDQGLPNGEAWHRDLLYQMAREVADVRPSVISEQTIKSLDELRRFRHLVRNVYTFNLVPSRITPLLSNLPKLWSQVKAELLAFADFLFEATQSTI